MANKLMHRLLSLSIRAQMSLMALIVALPAAGIILVSGIQTREAAIAAALQETRKISDRIANDQEHAASSAEQLMTALAQLPDIRNHEAEKARALFSQILKITPFYLNLSAVSPSGQVWASAAAIQNVSLADRRYFKNAMATGRLSSGEYIVSRMVLKPTLNLCYPYRDGSGKLAGALSIAFNLANLGDGARQTGSDTYSYTLLDHQGTLLATSGSAHKLPGRPGLPEVFRSMQQGADEGSFIAPGPDGKRSFITYRKLRLKGERLPYMYVAVAVPESTVVAKANTLLTRNLLIFALSLLAAFFVSWLIGKRSIIDRISVLQGAARRLAGGDLRVRVADGVRGGDLGELGKAFDEMAQKLEARERERDRAENALMRSEARYRDLFHNALLGIVSIGTDNRFVRTNQTFCDLLGYDEEELVGVRNFADVTYPDDIPESLLKHQAMVRREMEHYTLEKRYLTKQGQVVHVLCFVQGSYSDDGSFEGNTACILDITELRASEERMRLYFERQIVGMAISSPQKTWLRTNAKLQQMLGYSEEELCTLSWEELTHPEDLENNLLQFSRMVSGEIDDYAIEKRFLRKDGCWLYCFISVVCVRRHDGAVDYVLALYSDISERKQAELEIQRLQASLEQRVQERTAQLESAIREQESFSYSVSHDLRSPLRHINSYLAILREEFGAELPEGALYYLERSRSASSRMGKLIDGLLELSRVSRSLLVKERIDLSALACNVVTALQESEPGRVAEIEITPGLYALGDRILMGLVLENLVGNAWKYTSRNEVTRLAFGTGGSGRQRYFFVRDNGTGFDMAYRDKLFGAFQRLHGEEYEGTGIGLATVKRIMDRHGGAVWAEGEPDAGATFYFSLPWKG